MVQSDPLVNIIVDLIAWSPCHVSICKFLHCIFADMQNRETINVVVVFHSESKFHIQEKN